MKKKKEQLKYILFQSYTEELKKVNEEIKRVNNKFPDDLYKQINAKERELKILRKPIYERYVNYFPIRNGNWIKSIRFSVKAGIKAGLELKYFNLIYEGDIVKIVKRLIKEDLTKTNEEEIILELAKIQIERDNFNKRLSEERDNLEKKKKEIEYKLNKEVIDKENIKEKKREEISRLIEEKLIMEKIRGEVEKRLVIENLK